MSTPVLIAMAILTFCVAAEFVMIGELARLVDANGHVSPVSSGGPVDDESARLIDEVPLGQHLQNLPPSFSRTDPTSVPVGVAGLVVLSTTCNSCRTLAGNWKSVSSASPGRLIPVISCHRSADAEYLIQTTELPADTPVDVGGRWCQETLGLRISPALIALVSGTTEMAMILHEPSPGETIRQVLERIESQQISNSN
jgi:hypothetical protein